MALMKTDGFCIEPTALISAPQNFTADWADLGGEIDVGGMKYFSVGLEIDKNDSVDMRFRFLTKTALSTTLEFVPCLKPITASVNAIADEYSEFDVDADQNRQLIFNLFGCVQTVQCQIKAGTVGASAGQIDSAFYTASR